MSGFPRVASYYWATPWLLSRRARVQLCPIPDPIPYPIVLHELCLCPYVYAYVPMSMPMSLCVYTYVYARLSNAEHYAVYRVNKLPATT